MKAAYGSVLALAVCLAPARGDETFTEPKASCHGTAVEFVSSPVAAARLAAGQKKLVLVLHVSGHFEDPDFT